MSDAALAVLMRWPRRGEGKTRLAAQVGRDAAHRLHCAFVGDTLAWSVPWQRLLAVAPDDTAVERARAVLGRGAPVVAQAHGDLGHRIAAALRQASCGGARHAVLVGTDSPSLPAHLLAACVQLAVRSGAAMVPAEDGGFVALAVCGDVICDGALDWLRSGIEWSTERTAAQTAAAARRRGLDIALTAPWYDVDELDDLDRLHADLAAAPHRAPRTLRCLRRLDLGRGRTEEAS
jgi:uncharacterized protein